MDDELPPPNTEEIQATARRAELDLEAKIAQLKDVVKAKLEAPVHVVEAVEAKVSWLRANPRLVAAIALGGTVVTGLVLRALWRAVRPERAHSHGLRIVVS